MEYFELEPEKNIFYTLHAEITHRCNMFCNNCYLPNREEDDLSLKDLQDFLSRLPSRTDIRLIGAEPTLHKQLFEIIESVKKEGHRPILITNGLKLKDGPYVKRLWASGLRRLAISMNGADDYETYVKMDNATTSMVDAKLAGLDNCIQKGMIVNTQTILMKNINTNMMRRMVDRVVASCKKYDRKLNTTTFPVICRFKSIGQIGRYMENESLSLDELVSIASDELGVDEDFIRSHKNVNGFEECNAFLFPLKTECGDLYVKLTDWSTNSRGVPDAGSRRRGRITKDWKVAPCFENIKLNEFGF